MALSDIAVAVKISTVTATLAKLTTDKAGFRSDLATLLHTKFPNVTIAQAVADLTAMKVTPVVYPLLGYVGIGRGPDDAIAACVAAWQKANPGATLPVAGG